MVTFTEAVCIVGSKLDSTSVFGRVAEEASALREAGIQFEVVPGITAGIGAATYAQPLLILICSRFH